MAAVRMRQTNLALSEERGSDSVSTRVRQRFADKVVVSPDGCWLWQGAINTGYGQFYFEGRPQKAHRVSWQLFRGPIGDLNVLHRCDVTACVNPDHLFLGDQYDNHQDMTRKGRARVGVGSRHGNARLTEGKVRAIRLLLAEGVSASALATCLGVSIQAVCAVRDGRSWTHVEGEVAA